MVLSSDFPIMEKRGVDRDSIDPGIDVGILPKCMKITPYIDHDLLKQIFSIVLVIQIPITETIEPLPVFMKYCFK